MGKKISRRWKTIYSNTAQRAGEEERSEDATLSEKEQQCSRPPRLLALQSSCAVFNAF